MHHSCIIFIFISQIQRFLRREHISFYQLFLILIPQYCWWGWREFNSWNIYVKIKFLIEKILIFVFNMIARWEILLIFIVEICKERTGKLLHWDNPAASAGLFSGVLALLLSICYYSLVSVLAYISLGLLATIMAIKVYSAVMVFMKKVREVPPVSMLVYIIISYLT